MRTLGLLVTVAVAAMAVACGGATSEVPGSGEATKPGATGATDPPSTGAGTSGDDTPKVNVGPQTAGADCPVPTPVLVASGGTIARPTGSALRLELVYQGSSIGVTQVRGVDKILPGSNSPLVTSANSGYWFEARSGTSIVYQRGFRDPTNQEAPSGPNGEPFSNSTIDRCRAKSISADVPNNAAVTEIVVFGSPYGTQDAAVELARFGLK